jgi:hypothetical protein
MVVSLLCLDGHLQCGDVKIASGRSSSGRFVKYAASSLAGAWTRFVPLRVWAMHFLERLATNLAVRALRGVLC